MAQQQRTITIDEESDAGRLVQQADVGPFLVRVGSTRYRIERDPDDIFADYDPARALAALRQAAGALAGIDGERFKREILEQREQAGRDY